MPVTHCAPVGVSWAGRGDPLAPVLSPLFISSRPRAVRWIYLPCHAIKASSYRRTSVINCISCSSAEFTWPTLLGHWFLYCSVSNISGANPCSRNFPRSVSHDVHCKHSVNKLGTVHIAYKVWRVRQNSTFDIALTFGIVLSPWFLIPTS
jgi:hypothetical protein